MTCSPARLIANRENAAKSTGPRTEAGKARSRQNATRHGLAASADIVGPLDDGDRVGVRAEALAEELGATGEAGWLLAQRAALLSVRMERLAERDEEATQARMARAVAEAEAPRTRKLDRLIAELDQVGPERPLALLALWNDPAGVDRLLAFAESLVMGLAQGGVPAAEARRRAWGWLDPSADPSDLAPDLEAKDESSAEADLIERVAAEVARWEDRALELAPVAARIAREQRRMALDAAFDAGPEAALARRYEAAAERGFYRALQAIRQLRRDAAATHPEGTTPTPTPTPTVAPPAGATPPAPTNFTPTVVPPEATPPEIAAAAAPLGSFRAGEGGTRFNLVESAPMVLPRPLTVAEAGRRHRPDPRRLVASR